MAMARGMCCRRGDDDTFFGLEGAGEKSWQRGHSIAHPCMARINRGRSRRDLACEVSLDDYRTSNCSKMNFWSDALGFDMEPMKESFCCDLNRFRVGEVIGTRELVAERRDACTSADACRVSCNPVDAATRLAVAKLRVVQGIRSWDNGRVTGAGGT